MATNDFLVFGGGAGANVITQVTYSGLAARTAGFSAGVAQSAQLNKVWRQSSIMAAVLAQFIADNTDQDVLDDGTTATILTNLKSATAGRLLRTTVYTKPAGTQLVSVDGGTPTSTGAGTFTALANTKFVDVEVCGAGGGSGGVPSTTASSQGLGRSGGGGAYGRSIFQAGAGLTGVTLTVGAAGTAGAAGANAGGNGGTSSFGVLLSAEGGFGGGAGGTNSGVGSAGATPGGSIVSGSNMLRSNGGSGQGWVSSGLGFATGGIAGASGMGFPLGPGSGGTGQYVAPSSSAVAGIVGNPGVIIVREYA